MFLLDTNTVSEIRKRDRILPAAREVIETLELGETYLSVITILEVEIGIGRIERRDPRQASSLRQWLNALFDKFDGRILDVNLEIARRCALLHVPDPRPERDALLAATALVHGLTMVTRNAADFVSTGVAVLNPWNQGQPH
jgi:toxin FitB